MEQKTFLIIEDNPSIAAILTIQLEGAFISKPWEKHHLLEVVRVVLTPAKTEAKEKKRGAGGE